MNKYAISIIDPKKLLVYLSGFFILFLIVLECRSQAAEMPVYERLEAVKGSMSAPTNVALDRY